MLFLAILDYTNIKDLYGDPIKFAYKIKNDIYSLFGFTVNVGIGNNKLLAKMASDFSKPDKVHTLFKDEVKEKMWLLPVSELFMIGKSSSKKLYDLGIKNIDSIVMCEDIIGIWSQLELEDDMINVFEEIDEKKLQSSMTLFYIVSGNEIFKQVLDKFYYQELDLKTVKFLKTKN